VYPYYFGNSDRQLYGVYDTPRSNTFRDAGVLLCYPIGQEYMRSHWASRQLVSQICRSGLHCMRFDYFGTGDSAGMGYKTELGQWQSDVNTGLAEFNDISGVSKVSLVGLRFGAAIAATAPVQSSWVRKLVLWDPVVSGAAYINSLREMHNALNRLKWLRRDRVQHKSEATEELIGFRYSDRLISDIRSIAIYWR
jgi:pimeloyl-ACP methyl ester carboxylesterase